MNKTIVVNGINLAYQEVRSRGKSLGVIVMLHGWRGTKESWKHNLRDLSAQYGCIVVDLPGFGESETPDKPWGTIEYAEFLGQFLDALKIQSPVLIAKSFGARVAIVYASENTKRIKKLILVSAAGVEEKTRTLKIRIGVAKLAKVTLGILPDAYSERLRNCAYKLAGMKVENPYRREVKKAVTNQDLQERFPMIAAQTLIVWGDEDRVLPLAHAQKMNQAIDDSCLRVIPGGDHWVHQKQAEEFNRVVTEFLVDLD